MALLTANGIGVITASIMMPLYGIWSADLAIDQPNGTGFEAGTKVTIKADGGLSFTGTVVADRTGDFLDTVHVRILGGANGMAKPATVKGYVQPGALVRDVLNALAKDSGETLSDTISQSLLTTNLTAWATLEGTVSRALASLIEIVTPTSNWRILADGTLWVGDESWDSSSDEYELIDHNPAERVYNLGVDTLTIVPGVNLDGVGKVNRVEHTVKDGAVRSVVFVEIEDEDRGLAGSVQTLVRQEVAKLDYFAMYDAKIVSQSSDLSTVDIQPSDSRIPKLSKVALRPGVPGVSVQVTPGGFIRLGWDNGDPQKPFAALWQGGETPIKVIVKGAAVFLGDETGAKKLATEDHTHSFTYVPGTSGTSTATTDPPSTGLTAATKAT